MTWDTGTRTAKDPTSHATNISNARWRGNSAAHSISPAASSTSDAVASQSNPSGDARSLEVAGSRYLEIINPLNRARRALISFEQAHVYGGTGVVPAVFDQQKALVGNLAAARQAAYRLLLDEQWPAEVETLAREWSLQGQVEQEIADALNVDSFNILIEGMKSNPVVVTANPGVIRAILNLAPLTETDRC